MIVQIVLFDGFDLLDALAPYEVFCAAEMYSGGAIHAELVTAEGARPVSSGTNGLQITASGGVDLERAGILLIPGASGEVSGDGPNSVPVRLQRAAETELIHWAGEALGKPDLIVATVCGGSLLLAMGGLLEGRHAVTNHLGMDALGATGAIPVNARVVDDGNLVTGGGVTSGLDVALYLVERELGPRIANAVEKLFEYEKRGTVWHSHGIAPIVDGASSQAITAEPAPDVISETSLGNLEDDPVFEGVWKVVISTPIGKQYVTLNVTRENGRIHGTAEQSDEVVEFVSPAIRGNLLTWTQRVTKPMRLNLKFEVSVHGDEMTGTAKAGMLPASKITGKRALNRG